MRTALRRTLATSFAVLLAAVAVTVVASPANAADSVTADVISPTGVIHPGDVVRIGGTSDSGSSITSVEFFGPGEQSLGTVDPASSTSCSGTGSNEVQQDWYCDWTVPITLVTSGSTPVDVEIGVAQFGETAEPTTTSFTVVAQAPTLVVDTSAPVYPADSLDLGGTFASGWALDVEGFTATPAGGEAAPFQPDCTTTTSPYNCTLDGPIGQTAHLTPGSWTISASFFTPSDSEVVVSQVIAVASPATIAVTTAPVHPGDTIAFGGTRVAGGGISNLQVDGAPITPTCTGLTGNVTDWSCSWTPSPDLAVGDHALTATFIDGETDQPTDLATTFGVQALPAPPAPPVTPPVVPTASVWTLSFGDLDLNQLHPGDAFTASGAGLPPGATITFVLHSTPVVLGSTTADRAGRYTFAGVIPADTELGAHQIIATVTESGVATASVARAATVNAVAAATVVPATTATTSEAPVTTQAETPTTREKHESRAPIEAEVEPNVLTEGLHSIGDVVAHPQKVPAAIAVGLVLLILGVVPAHLLDATVSEQYERLGRRFPALARRPRWIERLHQLLRRAPGVGGLAVTTATAVLFCFADPRFGFTLASLRMLIALAVALFVVTYVVDAITSVIMRRAWKVGVTVSLRPLGLVLSLAGVVVSRLLDFSPGFLIGLVLGLSISGTAAGRYAWRAVLLRSGLVIAVAIAAWAGYSAFSHAGAETDWVQALLLELLVAIATEGIVALLVELLPLHLLEGERLFHRSKVLWGALYVLAVTVFVVAVVPWEGNWAELGSGLWTWLAILAGFAVIATGLYLFFRLRSREEHEVEDDTASPERVAIGED